MGATRKLQGEIDRVLKKVQEGVDVFDGIWNKVYDTENTNQKEKFEADLKKEIKKLQRYRDQIKTWIQSSEIKDKKALLDARKLIEREMERFKVCEKETKTKAFSKEGLGQQPKTDPREKARNESREWLNNMVSELEAQVDTFEAEMEGLAVKKGKTRPPRLVHLEESTMRHKSHIIKLEHILRLLDNDELSPEQVSDVKDLVEDYVERNQDDFEEFADVDEIYNQLPLDKLEESLDAVPLVASALIVKEKAAVAAASSNGLNSKVSLPSQAVAAAQAASAVPATPVLAVAALTADSSSADGPSEPLTISPRNSNDGSLPSTPHRTVVTPPGLASGRTTKTASMVVSGAKAKEEDAAVRRLVVDGGLTRSFARPPAQPPLSPLTASSGTPAGPTASEVAKRSTATDGAQQPASPLTVRPFSQGVSNKTADSTTTTDSAGFAESGVVGNNRLFAPSVSQWRPSPSEAGQFPGRTEIAPDQKQKFLKKLQQVQEEASHLSSPSQKQQILSSPQTSPLVQQALLQQQQQQQHASLIRGSQPVVSQPLPSPQQRATSPQLPVTPTSQQIVEPAKDAVQSESGLRTSEPQQQQQTSAQQQQPRLEDTPADTTMGFTRTVSANEDDLKNADTFDVSVGGPGTLAELSQLSRDADFTPGQQLPLTPSRRTGTELGAIGDNLSTVQDHAYNLQLLESSFRNLPLLKDCERPRSYTPRNPAKVPIPASYPQEPVPFIDTPALWEKFETDVLFFVFYYQQGTYQQYLAARELKKQFWRYHKKYNTWFQRHEEPKVTTDEYEQGTYVYFDCNIADDLQQGWVQRIKTEFTFEYCYLEDELVV